MAEYSQPTAARTDREVVDQILSGEVEEFEWLMRKYNQRLYRVARGVLGDHALAEDAVQNAYFQAFNKLRQFHGSHGIGPWLCRIALTESLALLRHRNRDRRLSMALRGERRLDNEGESAELHTPESMLHSQQLHSAVSSAIDALPSIYRVALVLREVEGLSVLETAAVLKIQPATVKTRVFRGRRMLRKRIGADCMPELSDTFTFAGADCDRLVTFVMERIISTRA